MVKFIKSLFSGATLNQAHLTALIGNVVTAVVTFVPAWAPDKQVIIAALGGVVSNAYPFAAAIHKAIGAIEEVLKTKVSLSQLESTAADVVKGEVGKIDFNKIVQDIENTHGLTAANVEQIAEQKVRAVIAQMFATTASPTLQQAPAPGVISTGGNAA